MSISRSDFFKQVLPHTGHICLVGLRLDKSAPPKTEFIPIESAHDGTIDSRIDEMMRDFREVYFGCATFKDPRGQRTAKNSVGYKCFRADVDCGPGKDYDTQKNGLLGLQKYLEETGLPMPTLVNSGRGWHIYWAIDEVLDYNTWRPIADALKASMADLQFMADPSVTADGARILRVPETFNGKDRENPKEVKIVKAAAPLALHELTSKLTSYLVDSPVATQLGLTVHQNTIDDPIMRKLIDSSEKKFSKILARSLKEVEVVENVEVVVEGKDGTRSTKISKQKVMRSAGCAQIQYIYTHQDDEEFDYNLWRAGLSIARNCTDWETAIHDISRLYPDYDPAYTLKVAEDTYDKPQFCKTFQSIRPSGCLTCALKKQGTLTTPLMLGATIIPATPLDNLQEQIWHEGLKEHIHVDIPITYPKPWFRPKTGGVATKGNVGDEGGGEDDVGDKIIYENDIWVQKLLVDPNHGAMIQVARLLPMDGMKEFTIPLASVGKRDRCLEALAFNGVAIQPACLTHMQKYITDWTNLLQKSNKAEKAREQFGWHDSNSKFVVGSREINKDGTVAYSPPCSVTEDIAPNYAAKGELDAWRTVVNVYNNPGNEARAFALFVSLGSPLYKFFNVNSMIVHLTNAASGVGKSTALMVANSVWGHPVLTMLNENDTPLSRQQRAGVLNNIVTTVDEITNLSGEEISDFVFRHSFDRARNRMQSQVNAERKNAVAWSTPAITSGNNSLYDSLKAHKTSSQGEMYRVLEIQVHRDNTLTKEQSDYFFNELLRENYGLAGEELMKYVTANLDTVLAQAKAFQKNFDQLAGFGSQERNYSALCAASFTMANIAYKLGLHNIDVARIERWAVKTIGVISEFVESTGTADSEDVLGQFLNEHIRNVLVINARNVEGDDALTAYEPPIVPYGELIIRYEPNTRRVYIAKNKLTTWCAKQRVPFAPLWDSVRNSGAAYPDEKFCLSKGTSLPGSTIWVVSLDADKMGWGDIDIPKPI